MKFRELEFELNPSSGTYIAVQDVLEFQRLYIIKEVEDNNFALKIDGIQPAKEPMIFESFESAKASANAINQVYMHNVADKVFNNPVIERYSMIPPNDRKLYTCARCGATKSVKYLVRVVKSQFKARLCAQDDLIMVKEVPLCHVCFTLFSNSCYGVMGSHANCVTAEAIEGLKEGE